jgi:hypothetical protein
MPTAVRQAFLSSFYGRAGGNGQFFIDSRRSMYFGETKKSLSALKLSGTGLPGIEQYGQSVA